MNCEQLIETLWQEAEKKIAAIVRETDEEETRISKETILRISRLREDSQQRCSSDSGKHAGEILSEAEKSPTAKHYEDLRLSERLYQDIPSFLRDLEKPRLSGFLQVYGGRASR
jgi:vacuolar-type H+-ATPase subunit E/Vma4